MHTKLGKPIPSAEPVVTPAAVSKPAAKPAPGKAVVVQSNTAAKKVLAAPKINFVGKVLQFFWALIYHGA